MDRARPTRRKALRRQAGAMYEVHLIIWPLVYGMAGHAFGVGWGHPWLGAVGGGLLGVVAAVAMFAALIYDVAAVCLLLGLVAQLLGADVRRWVLLGLCVVPWLRLAVGRVGRRPPRGSPPP